MAPKSKSGDVRQYAAPTTDPRFARLHTDPRFLRPQKDQSKVVLDDRFKGMLDGPGGGDFGVHKRNSKIDRFGRKLSKADKSRQQEEAQRLYKVQKEAPQDVGGSESDSNESEEFAGDDNGYADYARGAADLDSSSEEDEEDEEDEASSSGDSDEDDHVAIGKSSLLRKERKRRGDDSDSGDGSDVSDAESIDEAAEAELDPQAVAALDAQAARTVAGAADNEAGPSAAGSSTIRKRKTAKQSTLPPGSETKRLAVVNMDWDHVRALDLYKVFSSLVSPLATQLPRRHVEEDEEGGRSQGTSSVQVKGTVQNVRIYPSDFGRERMKREDIEGPPKDIFKSEADSSSSKKKKKSSKKGKKRQDADEDEDDQIFEVDEGGEFDEEALRKYQLQRLRYYYAIATFDSPETARHVYDAVDGSEMERTANIFDLQFVPDEMEFPESEGGDEGWRDEARPGLDDGVTYKGADWATDALRHSKVKLTWDAPDPERTKIMSKRHMTKDQIRDEDFKAYLASDSEDSGDESDEADAKAQKGAPQAAAGRDRFRALMGLDDQGGSRKSRPSAFEDARDSDDERNGRHGDGEDDGDMEITFMPGLSEAAARKASGATKKDDGEETTLEKYMRKQREKKQRRKEAREAGDNNEEAVEERAAGQRAGVGDASSGAAGGFDDPFFASDNEDQDVDYDAVLAKEHAQNGVDPSTQRRGHQDEDSPRPERDIPDDVSDDGRKHFSLQDVLKAEAAASGTKKPNRWEKKRLAKLARQQAAASSGAPAAKDATTEKKAETQDGFAMDVSDPRFHGSLMGDHRFALDPTHPSFHKTGGMQKLLDERRRHAVDSGGKEGREEDAVAAEMRRGGARGDGDGRDTKRRRKEVDGRSNVNGDGNGSNEDPSALLRALKGQNGSQMRGASSVNGKGKTQANKGSNGQHGKKART